MSSVDTNRPPKRVRLSRACNHCRSRKVRCDEQQPSCSNCTRQRVECVTTDPKNPSEDVTHFRRRAKSGVATSPSDVGPTPVDGSTINAGSARTGSEIAQSPVLRRSPIVNVTPLNGSGVRLEDTEHQGMMQREQRPETMHGIINLTETVDNDQSPGFAVNGTIATERKYLGSTSLQVFSQWLDLTFHVPSMGLTGSFQHGMRVCEEMDLPADICMPSIPDHWQQYVDAFFSCVGAFFPITTREHVHLWAQQMQHQDLKLLPTRQRPLIAIIYACLAIGADTLGCIAQGTEYLTAAYSLYAFLVSQPYLQSSQALLLICIALRGRNKDGAASQALGQAIRILHSIGLHRSLVWNDSLPPELLHDGPNSWWSAYCLERIMSLETGRPSHISDKDVNQQKTSTYNTEPLQALVGLAGIQGRISDHLSTTTLPAITEVLETQCHMDQALVEWQKNLPSSLRCDGDLISCDPGLALPRAFLSIQFHSTMITLHRTALLMDKGIHRAHLARYNQQGSDLNRLVSSESICASSARAIITTYLQAREISHWSRLQTLTGPLMATYVLSINTLKNPNSWSARSDMGLIHSAAEAVEQGYYEAGQDPGFCTLLKTLRQFASQNTLKPLSRTVSPRRPPVSEGGTGPRPDIGPNSLPHGQNIVEPQYNNAYDSILPNEWDLLFPHLYVGDIAFDNTGLQGVDIEHLMGIPHLSYDEPH